jgi:hypothetical protein
VADSAEKAWEAVRADDSIQFEPPKPKEPEMNETPQWLKDVGQWFSDLFDPLAGPLSSFWFIAQYILIGLLIVGVLVLLYVIFKPIIENAMGRSGKDTPEEIEWRPDSEAAQSLLSDADQLADQGDYAAAVRLILQRSIADIAKANPRAVIPSNTAREIGRFEILSASARQVFAMIAGHVERGIFASQPLGREAWEEARRAYDNFAFGRSG